LPYFKPKINNEQRFLDRLPLPTSLKESRTNENFLQRDNKEKKNAYTQKQECDCPSLQTSLRSHTHTFLPTSLHCSMI
jgi:hypothetical protein